MEEFDIQAYAPTELSVHEYVEARAQEMLAMASAAKTVVGNNLPLQKLPRHMRRRAASHYVKRLPRKMQSWAEREYAKAGPPSKSKRPSRKHRRRPGNLLEEYSRRRRKNIWLETHIWHAKRFHMTEMWGYKIALHPNDKGSRAAYRASSKYCLLQDVSYYVCVEICGPLQDILTGLGHLTSPDTGLTFGAKAFLKGTREGTVMVYCYNKYPYGVLGPVKYIWRYMADTDGELNTQTRSPAEHVTDRPSQIWIWTHPAMYRDFMEELKKAFLIQSVQMEETSSANSEARKVENMCTDDQVEQNMNGTAETKPESLDNFQQESFSNSSVTVTSLKDLLCRFHLTGPLSNQILSESLMASDIKQSNDLTEDVQTTQDGNMTETEEGCPGSQTIPWWKNCFINNKLISIHETQKEFLCTLKGTKSPAEILSHCVIGLTVRDPRKLLPPKKSMVHCEESCPNVNRTLIVDDISWSPLWLLDVRDNVKATKQPDSVINALRSRLLVPGMGLPISSAESRIPVLLIQNPGHQSVDSGAPCCLGYGSGWDIIIPSGWSMPFLMNFVYRGARVGGLKEYLSTMVEAGQLSYPGNFPDSAAGHDWELREWRQHKEKYDRTPPAKRINYEKLGIVAPFQFPWCELIAEWAASLSTKTCLSHGECTKNRPREFYVIRNNSVLKKLQIATDPRTSKHSGSSVVADKQVSQQGKTLDVMSLLDDCWCLVPVRINILRRGHPEPYARICLPTSEDITKLRSDPSYCGPLEGIQRKNGDWNEAMQQGDTEKLSGSSSVMCSCSRKVIGFIKEGGFSYASGCGFGLGFVAYPALLEVLKMKTSSDRCLVLIRNISSLHYQFAKLSVVICFN